MADSEERIKISFDTNADEAKKGIDSLSASLSVTDSKAEDLAKTFEEVYGDLKPLTTRMGEAEDRLYELALAGQTASQEYKDLLAAVANYRKTQIQTDRVVDAAATTLGEKLGGAAQIAATGVQGVTAGMALFGDQSEDTEKALLKVQAAMAFADAISNVSTLGGQWRILKSSILESSIVTKANTAATGAAAIVQKLFTGSVATTTVGFKALKLAIAATGIGLLVVGLVSVYQNFDKISKLMTNLVPGLAGVGEKIGNIVNSITDFVGVTSDADRAIDRIKDNADQSLALNKKFLSEHGDQLNEFTKQKIDAKNRYNEAVKEDGADQIALAKRLNRELAAIEYSRGDESRKIQKENAEKAAKERSDKEKQRTKERADLLKKELEEYNSFLKAQKDALEKQQQDISTAIDKATEENIARNLTDKENELRAVGDKYFSLIEYAKQYGLDTSQLLEAQKNEELEINKKYNEKDLEEAKKAADEKIEIDKRVLEQKKELQDAQFSLAESAVNFLSQIAGKNKGLQKAAIIAESALGIGRSIIATNAGNIAATAEGAALAIPTAGASVAAAAAIVTSNTIAAGIGIAANIAATAKALKALGGGAVSSGGNAAKLPSVRGAAATPQTGFQASSENQIATSINATKQDTPIVKAYVVAADMTDQQKKDKNLISQNSFGGVT